MTYQRFNSFGDNVNFDKVSIEGPVSRVTVDVSVLEQLDTRLIRRLQRQFIQATTLLVDTSLEPVMGTFYAQASLLISTIMA